MFSSSIKVNFYDADPAGIIFFANLFRFAHAAYENFMASISPERNFFFDPELVLPIVHAEGKFSKPIAAGDNLTIDLWVNELRGNSFELGYKFYLPGGVECAEAKTVHVCVAKKGFVKTALPESLSAELKNHLVG
jgi:YbgC/YbaW family acyl-CoA thioester hydrolase